MIDHRAVVATAALLEYICKEILTSAGRVSPTKDVATTQEDVCMAVSADDELALVFGAMLEQSLAGSCGESSHAASLELGLDDASVQFNIDNDRILLESDKSEAVFAVWKVIDGALKPSLRSTAPFLETPDDLGTRFEAFVESPVVASTGLVNTRCTGIEISNSRDKVYHCRGFHAIEHSVGICNTRHALTAITLHCDYTTHHLCAASFRHQVAAFVMCVQCLMPSLLGQAHLLGAVLTDAYALSLGMNFNDTQCVIRHARRDSETSSGLGTVDIQ